ncbi:MAG: hypothetical protein GY913_13815 [Proteobacteria bacterium]|nr:hypothetical protein [Pseudomonadota bacterium]MCP4917985.1 hypothetical protein [Pseudomonadota bacterium]
MILLALACTGETDEVTSDSGPAQVDCPGVFLEVELVEPGTVALVRVESDEPVSVTVERVERVESGEPFTDLPPVSAEATEHVVTVRGLPLAATVELDIVAGECARTEIIETDAADWTFPYVTDVLDTGAVGDGGWFPLTLFTETGQYAVILGSDGTPVWWTTPAQLPTRTAVAHDRLGVLSNGIASSVVTDGFVQRHSWTGEVTEHVVPRHHTDFTERPDGTLGVLVYEVQEIEGRSFLASGIVEVSPDGEQRELWSAFDADEPKTWLHYAGPIVDAGGIEDLEEWMHINSISWSEDQRAYVVTEGNEGRLFRIAEDGTTDWVVGWDDDEVVPESRELVRGPHSAELQADGTVLVFNRGTREDLPEQCAYVTHLEIDTDAGVARQLDRYAVDDCFTVTFFGEARARADGMFVNYSSAGLVDLVDANGQVAHRLQTDLGAAFGYGDHIGSLYP